MSILKVEGLTHIYSQGTPFEKVAIDHISLEFGAGELVGIIGRTGSGKSTFIQHLNGLLKPTEGTVSLDGTDIHSSRAATRDARFKVGLVFQYPEYQLFEETVYQDIAFGPKNMKLPKDEIDRRVREAADFAGFDPELLEKSPFELSGGQKRRAAIAGVIAMHPQLLILDEPTAGLDPGGCKDILNNLRRYQKESGTAILMVSHSMEEVADYADRLMVLGDKHVLMDGTPAEVFSRAKELEEMGLAVPAVTDIAVRLGEMGIALPPVYTVSAAADAIMAAKEGMRHA